MTIASILRRLASLESIRAPRRKKSKRDVVQAYANACGCPVSELTPRQRERCDELWARIQQLRRTDDYFRCLFDCESDG
jgi:hypothetical protein